jgi:hypothetical protein
MEKIDASPSRSNASAKNVGVDFPARGFELLRAKRPGDGTRMRTPTVGATLAKRPDRFRHPFPETFRFPGSRAGGGFRSEPDREPERPRDAFARSRARDRVKRPLTLPVPVFASSGENRVAVHPARRGRSHRHGDDEADSLRSPSPYANGPSPRGRLRVRKRSPGTNPKPTPARRYPDGSPARPVDGGHGRPGPPAVPVTGHSFGDTVRSRIIGWRAFRLAMRQESVSVGLSFGKSVFS